MSISKLEEIRCPCGEVFEAELWSAISGSEDPDLKEALLCGEINIVCCPACSEIFYAEHFIIYHDVKNEILAFVYPFSFSENAEAWIQKMKDDFANAMVDMLPEIKPDYEPIVLFGLDALVEIIRDDDEMNDESKILEYIAEEHGLMVIELIPSAARQSKLPALLPSLASKRGNLRDQVLAGLICLLEHNDRLTHYQELFKKISNDPNWDLDKKLIKKSKKTSLRR
jgi:hypothetical protein